MSRPGAPTTARQAALIAELRAQTREPDAPIPRERHAACREIARLLAIRAGETPAPGNAEGCRARQPVGPSSSDVSRQEVAEA